MFGLSGQRGLCRAVTHPQDGTQELTRVLSRTRGLFEPMSPSLRMTSSTKGIFHQEGREGEARTRLSRQDSVATTMMRYIDSIVKCDL